MKCHTTYYDKFCVHLEHEDMIAASLPGRDAAPNVKFIIKKEYIKSQFCILEPSDIRNVLLEFGAWNTEELMDDTENQRRLIWIAACDIKDELRYNNGKMQKS